MRRGGEAPWPCKGGERGADRRRGGGRVKMKGKKTKRENARFSATASHCEVVGTLVTARNATRWRGGEARQWRCKTYPRNHEGNEKEEEEEKK